MGAYDGLSDLFKKPLAEYAREYGYGLDNVLILQGRAEELRENYPKTYENLKSCSHHADDRSFMDYGRDLVASWIFEDFLLRYLQSQKYRLSLSGADRKRKILAYDDTSSTSDYEIIRQGKTYKMELACDYGDFWKRQGKLHLRDDKYGSIRETGGMLLAVSVKIREFMILDFRREMPHKKLRSHKPFGGKSAVEIPIRWNGKPLQPKSNVEAAILDWMERFDD